MDECAQVKQKNPAQSTARYEYTMRSTFQTLKSCLLNLERIQNDYMNSPARYPNVRDKPSRIEKVKKFVIDAQVIVQAYENLINIGKSGIDEEQPLIRNKGADGEYDDTRDLTNQQLLQQQKDHLKKQDD